MDDKLKSVLNKIAKLRALAAGTGSQAEAEAAAAQAAALITKYQIDEATVETASQRPTEEIGEGDVLWEGARSDRWRSLLAAALGIDHGCAVIDFYHARGIQYRIVGRPSDVAIVRYLFAWLHHEIARLSEKEHGRAAKNAFRTGAVGGVISAMRKARGEENKAAAEKGTTAALAIVDRHDAAMGFFRAEAAKLGAKVGVASKPRLADRDALRRGIAAGENLAPRPGLTGAEGRFMLGSGGQ